MTPAVMPTALVPRRGGENLILEPGLKTYLFYCYNSKTAGKYLYLCPLALRMDFFTAIAVIYCPVTTKKLFYL